MKLYATITSERASKGQGGNNFLDIKLQYRIKDINAFYGCITLSQGGVLTFTNPLGDVHHIATLRAVGLDEGIKGKQ